VTKDKPAGLDSNGHATSGQNSNRNAPKSSFNWFFPPFVNISMEFLRTLNELLLTR
jgi:hypothetical protein